MMITTTIGQYFLTRWLTGSSDYFTGEVSITEDIAFPVTKNLRVTVNDLDTVSRDSKLSMLEISVNGDILDSDLNPSFDPDETEYELIVDNRNLTVGSTSTVITPTLSDANSANAVLVFEQTNTTIVSGEGQMIDLRGGEKYHRDYSNCWRSFKRASTRLRLQDLIR